MAKIGEDVQRWIALSGLPTSTVASRADINRSHLYRIINNAVSPTLDTLTDIAIACGQHLTIATSALSDPDAASAARFLVDDAYAALTPTSPQQEWIDRLVRIVGTDEPLAIVDYAGHAASLLARPGAIFLNGPDDTMRLASAGHATGGSWAISGAPAFPGAVAQQIAATHTPHTILYVENPQHAAQLLHEYTPMPSAQGATHIIVGGVSGVEVDAYTLDNVTYVAPVQMLLDAFGLGDPLEQLARREGESW